MSDHARLHVTLVCCV